MDHEKQTDTGLVKPTGQLANQSLDEALSTVATINRSQDGLPVLLDPLARMARRKKTEILERHANQAIEVLREDHKAHMLALKEWHERALNRLKGKLRASDVEYFNGLLETVYTNIQKSGQSVAMQISKGIDECSAITIDEARNLQMKRLTESLHAHYNLSKRLRENFEASVEAQTQV